MTTRFFGRRISPWIATLAVLLAGSTVAEAAVLTFDATDRGWFRKEDSWSTTATYTATNLNTLTGKNFGAYYNSFFLFDLTGLTGTVTSATLELELESYSSTNASESFTVHDVATPGSSFSTDQFGAAGFAIFSDLESGNVYSTATVTSADVGSIINMSLLAPALADLTAASGLFVVGVAVDGPYTIGSSGWEGVRFSNSDEVRVHRLTLEGDLEVVPPNPVPEPFTLAIWTALGAGAAGLALRRRKNTARWSAGDRQAIYAMLDNKLRH